MKIKITINLLIFLCIMIMFSLTGQTVHAVSKKPSRINVSFYNEEVNSRGFNWVTDENVDENVLQIIKKTEQMDIDSIDWSNAETIVATSNDFYPEVRAWKAHILNLEYQSTYYYRVGSQTEDVWSSTGEQYITDGSEGVRFMHVTDPQSYSYEEYTKWTNTIDIITENFPKTTAMLMAGDLTQQYKVGSDNINEWGYALDGPKDFFMNNIITPASGNHDKFPDMFSNHFNIELPNDQNTETGQYYTYVIKDVQVIVLNTNDELTTSSPLGEKQVTWLEETLKNSTATWKIVVFHHALISTGRHMLESDIASLRTTLMPLFSKYEVDLAIQGHDHVYTRSEPYEWHANGFEASEAKPSMIETINNHQYEYYEQTGTFYVLQNMATARVSALSPLSDPLSIPSFMKIATSDINGMFLSQQTNFPTFGYITIKDGKLLYETYMLDNFSDLVLYDYFGITKNNPSIIEEKINLLPDQFNQDMLEQLADVINDYNQLTEEHRNQVDQGLKTKLLDLAENVKIEDYNQAQILVSRIKAFNRIDISENQLNSVDQLMQEFEVLSNIAKSYVSNYEQLNLIYLEQQRRIEAKQINDRILEILDNENVTSTTIASIRDAYNDLAEEAKWYVVNYFDFIAIEASFDIFEDQREMIS